MASTIFKLFARSAFLLTGLFFSFTTIYSQDVPQTTEERYRIGFQDRLSVQVFRHPELSQTIEVNPNGTINLFRLPEPVVAVCKTERELANDIAAAYRKDYLRNPEVNVTVSEQRSQAFAVTGAVVKPANYMLSRKVRLLELLAAAGGPAKEAGSTVIVARTGSTSNCTKGLDLPATDNAPAYLSFKLKDVVEGRENPVMLPGDMVFMQKEDAVYVYGDVNEQGPVTFSEPITLMQAIASAKGFRPAAKKDKVRIFRQKRDSLEREELTFDMGKIAKRETNDPFLEPGDVVAVTQDQAKNIFQSIGRSVTGGLPSLFLRFP